MEIISHSHPEPCLDRLLAERGEAPFALGVCFTHRQYYLPGEPELRLLALFWRERVGDGVRFAVTEQLDPEPGESPAHFAARLQLPVFHLDRPLQLQPVHIPKPWGQEIWYTGIEARGQSGVGELDRQIPLPWLLAALPGRFAAGRERGINLLKILDPLPDEVYGDLYFEMHEEKREVYIVTRVDPEAWPDGTGAIRFGFCPDKRAEYASDRAFLDAYTGAVRSYRQVREEIDTRFDTQRARAGIEPQAPVTAETLKRWDLELPRELRDREASLRATMDSFTAMRPLVVGDVVSVPTFTPHSLQHGVRTVEFQTPVYERKILSFAQKVLTQGHWDTEEALARVRMDTPAQPAFRELERARGLVRERIVDFADFTVDRVCFLEPGRYRLEPEAEYCIAMVIGGSLGLGQISAAEESAWLLGAGTAVEVAAAQVGAVLLLARPIC